MGLLPSHVGNDTKLKQKCDGLRGKWGQATTCFRKMRVSGRKGDSQDKRACTPFLKKKFQGTGQRRKDRWNDKNFHKVIKKVKENCQNPHQKRCVPSKSYLIQGNLCSKDNLLLVKERYCQKRGVSKRVDEKKV